MGKLQYSHTDDCSNPACRHIRSKLGIQTAKYGQKSKVSGAMSNPDGINGPWGARLQIWREEQKCWSVEEFVEQVIAVSYKTNESRGHSLDPRLVRRWESGEIQRPQGVYRRILAQLGAPLPLPAPRAGHVLSSDRPRVPRRNPEDRHVDRRTFLTASAVADGAGYLTPPEHEFEALRRGLDDLIGERSWASSYPDDWEQAIDRHAKATRDRPANLMLADLSADMAGLERDIAIASASSSMAARPLLRVAAQMGGLMCLTFIKLGDRETFARWARTANTAAAEIGDRRTQSWVLAQEAYGHYYGGDTAYAISVARHAQEIVSGRPSVGAVLAAALEARAHATLGPAREREARDCLRNAEALLASLHDDELTASALGYNEAQFRFHAGNVLTHLHDTEGAWLEQERALQLYPDTDYLDVTLTRLDHAHCLAYDGDAREAIDQATQALVTLDEPRINPMITTQARQVVSSLPVQQRALPVVEEFRALLHTLPATNEE